MDSLPPSARLTGIGFYIGTCIVLGAVAGLELDKLLDTGRLLTVIGIFLGLALAIYGGIRQLMDVLAEINRRSQGKEH